MTVALRTLCAHDDTVAYSTNGGWRVHSSVSHDTWVRGWRDAEMYVRRFSGDITWDEAASAVFAAVPCAPQRPPQILASTHFEDDLALPSEAARPLELLKALVARADMSHLQLLFVSRHVERSLIVDQVQALTFRSVAQSLALAAVNRDGHAREVACFEGLGSLPLERITEQLLAETPSRVDRSGAASGHDVCVFRELKPVYRYLRTVIASGSLRSLLPDEDQEGLSVRLEDQAVDHDSRLHLPFDDDGVVRLEAVPLIAGGRCVGELSHRSGRHDTTGNGFLDGSGRIRPAAKLLTIDPGTQTEHHLLESLPRAIVINAITHVGMTTSGRLDLTVESATLTSHGDFVRALPPFHIACRLIDLLGGGGHVVSLPTKTRRRPALMVELPWRTSA